MEAHQDTSPSPSNRQTIAESQWTGIHLFTSLRVSRQLWSHWPPAATVQVAPPAPKSRPGSCETKKTNVTCATLYSHTLASLDVAPTEAPRVLGGAKRVLEGAKHQNDSFLSMHCHRRNAKNQSLRGEAMAPLPPLDPPLPTCYMTQLLFILAYILTMISAGWALHPSWEFFPLTI